MSYCVYKHTFPNGKVYIGITCKKPEYRWNHGCGYTAKRDNGEYHQPYIARAILKYGWGNVEHEILFSGLTKEEAERKEIKLIEEYKSNQPEFGYNIQNGGKSNGVHSKETKRKISESLMGEKNHFYGKRHTKESLEKMSKAHNGENHPLYGKHLSEETKRKISKGKIGEKNPMYGKKHTKESLKKMSKVQSGEGNGMYGKKHSEETKRKIGEKKKMAVRCVETNIVYCSQSDAACKTGILQQSISNVCHNKQKTAGGYHWEFVKEENED